MTEDTPTQRSIITYFSAFTFITVGIGLAVAGVYIGETDDAPGAALLGLLLMVGFVLFAVRTLRRGRKTSNEEQ